MIITKEVAADYFIMAHFRICGRAFGQAYNVALQFHLGSIRYKKSAA